MVCLQQGSGERKLVISQQVAVEGGSSLEFYYAQMTSLHGSRYSGLNGDEVVTRLRR